MLLSHTAETPSNILLYYNQYNGPGGEFGQVTVRSNFAETFPGDGADLLEDLFDGRLELIGAGNEGQMLLDALEQWRVSDLTLLDDGDPLKAKALRRLHYVRAVFDERPRVRTQEALSPIIERISGQMTSDPP
jgi:hypothetical protein